MTTTVKVISHNYPVLVQTLDGGAITSERVLRPADGEQMFYATTTREIRAVDLEYDDPRANPKRPAEASA